MNGQFACFIAFFSVIAASAQDDFPLKKEDIHGLIREIAPQIEERFKGSHPEADGLVQRMEETLALPPPPPKTEGDRAQRLARHMTLVTAQAGFKCSITGPRGAVFDDEETGHLQRYRDLENTAATDAEEVWRWLEMRHAAKQLDWKDQKETCMQRALGAARAFVSREPKNALAHTLLALALEWGADTGAEKLAALQSALKLDPKQPLALHALLDRRVEKTLEEAALRQPSALEEKSPRDVDRALFDQPLSEDERLAFEKTQDSLRRETERLLLLARERGDLTAYLKTVDLLTDFQRQRMKAALAAARSPDATFEGYMAREALGMVNSVFEVFNEDTRLRDALELAREDVEATGSILLVAVLGDAMHALRDKQPLKPSRQEIFSRQLSALVALAGSEESKRAARAAEAVCIIEMGLMMTLQRPPQHLDLLLRAVKLDPFRLRTQGVVMGMCMSMDDLPGAYAMAQLQLALAPNPLVRRWCAAAAAAVQDWSAAHRHLDACLKEKPDDVALLNQKAATLLRENQSKATQKKAAAIFDKIETLREDAGRSLGNEERAALAENRILFLAICGKNNEAKTELSTALQNKSLAEKEGKELEELLR